MQLVDAAAQCFAGRPYDEVSMDDIAEVAGVAKALLFYYFGSKRGCYLAVIENFSTQLQTVAETDPDLPPDKVLDHMLDVYLDFAENAEPAFRTLMSGGLGNDPHARSKLSAERAKYRALLIHLVLPGRTETPSLRVLLEGFMSFMEGATLDWLTHRQISRAELQSLLVGGAFALLAVKSDADSGAETDDSALESTQN